MLYLSQVLGRPIREVEGERVATLKDVIVRLGSDHPPVTGLVARYRRRDFFVPRARVALVLSGVLDRFAVPFQRLNLGHQLLQLADH